MQSVSTTLLTAEEFLGLAEQDGVQRELIEGELREEPMTTRSPKHSTAVGRFTQALNNWLDDQADIDGVVGAGEVRCRLSQNPDTIVGIDVAYFAGSDAVRQSEGAGYFDGAPLVAVEVLSPSDTHEDTSDKIRRYLAAGTKQVWVADPDFRTVTVYRADASPVLYHAEQMLNGEPELTQFCVKVNLLFSGKAATSDDAH